MRRKPGLAAIIAATGFLSLSGCIGVPIALPEAKPFKDVVDDQFVVGETTSADIVAELGDPTWHDAQRLIYQDSRAGWRWFFCAGAGYSGGCAATDRTSKDFFLLAELDGDRTLTAVYILTEQQLCDEQRVCFKNELLMQAADVADDVMRKEFTTPESGCTLYVYSGSAADSIAGPIEVNGRTVGAVVGDDGYFAIDLDKGRHIVVITPAGAWYAGAAAASTVECSDAATIFLRYSKSLFGVHIEPVPDSVGRNEIVARWLARSRRMDGEGVNLTWLQDGNVVVMADGITVKAYRPGEPGKMTWWGATLTGETCGMTFAIEDYGLRPAGAHRDLILTESPTSPVKVIPVCNAGGDCDFPSVFDGQQCRVWSDERIQFQKWEKLLIIEPADSGYREVFYGESKQLKGRASCTGRECMISLAELRD